MNQLPTGKHQLANGSLVLTTVIFFFMNGAGIFETAVVIPAWTANPPASLGLVQGEYALDLKSFWIAAHSLHELTFILAIILNWKFAGRRKLLLIIFVFLIALRVWTITYFAPTVIYFQQIKVTTVADELLRQKALLWENLNLVRTGMFTILSLAFLPLIKSTYAQKN